MLLIVFYLPRSILFIVASQAGLFFFFFFSKDFLSPWTGIKCRRSRPPDSAIFCVQMTVSRGSKLYCPFQQVPSNYITSCYPFFLPLFSSLPSHLFLCPCSLPVLWLKGPPVSIYWWFFFKDQKQKQNQNKTNSTPPEKSPFICELVSKKQSALRAFFLYNYILKK